ncbi:MAG TPA: carboxypeptidase-like regulatory domain-containing protein, partial [Thermoanaerobaculia bacterium]
IDGAPTGTVRISARTGQGFGAGGKTSPVKSVQIDPGASVQADIEFKTTTISGRVTQNGQPMSSAIVRFMPRNAQAQTNASATTDGSGAYQVSGLDDAPYNVQVVDLQRTTPYTTTYTVSGSGSFDIDIKAAPLRGRVVDASTGAPISDARVQISAAGGDAIFSNRAAPTDPSGNFLIDNVAQGSYQAKAEKEGYGHDIQNVTIGDSGSDDLVFKLAPSSGVTIHVVDQRDNRAIGANVTRVVDAQNRDVDLGSFRFGGGPDPIKLTLSAGVYRVTLAAMGYAPQTVTITSPSEPTIAMSPGGTVVLRSKSSTLLRARLLDSNGVAYSRGGFGAGGVFTIDPSPGLTTLNNISAGTYQLQILDSTGRVVNTISVTVVDGQQVQVDV